MSVGPHLWASIEAALDDSDWFIMLASPEAAASEWVNLGRFRDAIADLAASMHGIAKDELEGEDIRNHGRALRLARGGVTVLVLLLAITLVTTGFALVHRVRQSARIAGSGLLGLARARCACHPPAGRSG